jgi:hypothetical protein
MIAPKDEAMPSSATARLPGCTHSGWSSVGTWRDAWRKLHQSIGRVAHTQLHRGELLPETTASKSTPASATVEKRRMFPATSLHLVSAARQHVVWIPQYWMIER